MRTLDTFGVLQYLHARRMTTTHQLVGALAVAILVPSVLRAQDGTAATPAPPSVATRDASTLTNSPAAIPLTIPQPAEPQITVPHAAQVEVPLATAPPPASATPVSRSRPTALTLPTTQELLSKSIESAPGGTQGKLNGIATIQPGLSPTNADTATTGTGALSLTNSPATPPNIWEKKSPLLNGVDYHW